MANWLLAHNLGDDTKIDIRLSQVKFITYNMAVITADHADELAHSTFFLADDHATVMILHNFRQS